ncbi:MAG: DUF4911 domain-containing protein [Desulfovibrio sp.]|nr:DUF4911 domain-containing protein [Desulfovibrio sp.]
MQSAHYLIRVAPEHIAMFRYLLESYGHTGYFTVLERKTALLKFSYVKEMESVVRQRLQQIAVSVPFCLESWPFECIGGKNA